MRLIATEEAWSIPEVAAELKKVANGPSQSLDKLLVKGIYDAPTDSSGYGKLDFLSGLLDAEQERLRQMDEYGVDMPLMALTAPGVLDRCIYIHPRAARDTLQGPLQEYWMDPAMWGYGVEVGTHAVRMMAG